MVNKPLKVITKTKLTPVFEMIEEASKTYFKNIKKFIEIYLRGLVGFIPFVALGLLFILLTSVSSVLDNIVVRTVMVLVIFIAGVWAIYYGIRVRAAMIILIKNNYNSPKDCFEDSKNFFWGYVWVSILSTLIIGLWAILLIIPGIIFAIYYLLFNYTFFFEGLTGMQAIRRSKELVKGYWWAVFGRVMFIGLMAGIINIFLASPLSSMQEGGSAYVSYNALMNFIWALISPIIVIYIYDIFRDLVAIKAHANLK